MNVGLGPVGDASEPFPPASSGLAEERYPCGSHPTHGSQKESERQAHTERVNVGPSSEGPSPVDGSGLTDTRYPCASDPTHGKKRKSEQPAHTERVNVGLGPVGDASQPFSPASSGLAEVRYPCAPSAPSQSMQEGQLTIYRSGTGPLTTETYIERAVPVAVPHIVYIDRPIYIEKYLHIPYPVHVPIPFYAPPADPQTHITYTTNNQLHLHVAAPTSHPPSIEAPRAPQITEIPDTGSNPALPDPPRRLEQDRNGPTKRSAAEALCVSDDEDDAPQSPTPSQRARKQKMTLTPARRAELEAYKQEETPAARRRRWSTWDEELETQMLYHLWGERREEIKRWRRSAPPSPRQVPPKPTEEDVKHEEKNGNDTQDHHAPATSAEDAAATSSAEEHSHDWKEGARIGEANNPGPPSPRRQPRNSPRRSHTPQGRTNRKPTQASRRGDRAVSKAPAGERTKGNRPGPKPSNDRLGNRPGGNGGGVPKAPAAMRNEPTSSAGTAQRNPNRKREDRRDPEEEQWIKVQGKKMKAMYEDIERMADTLRRLVDEVTFLRSQPEQEQARQTRRDPNPWTPLSRRAATRTPRSIGNQPPSRNTSVDTRDQDTTTRRRKQRPRSPPTLSRIPRRRSPRSPRSSPGPPPRTPRRKPTSRKVCALEWP